MCFIIKLDMDNSIVTTTSLRGGCGVELRGLLISAVLFSSACAAESKIALSGLPKKKFRLKLSEDAQSRTVAALGFTTHPTSVSTAPHRD